MKTEQKLEVYRELFGSLPDVPEGQELANIEYRAPKQWDIYHFSNGWLENLAGDYEDNAKRMVAIFQDTHRADGTPLSIDPLPEVEGYRVEYFGRGMSDLGDADRFIYIKDGCKSWFKGHYEHPGGNESNLYARLYKVKPPTTLADLVGKHGQNNVWLYSEAGSIAQVKVSLTTSKRIHIDSWSVKDNAEQGKRWSNDPFTTWEKANEFVV